MISLSERIEAFDWLGQYLNHLPDDDLTKLIELAIKQNQWFDENSIRFALEAITKTLKTELLEQWVAPYDPGNHDTKRIGVIMAGNIPLVGFHDFLSVLISGHQVIVKLSSQDSVLLPQIVEHFTQQFPRFNKYISFQNSIIQADAIIATGSDNSARYFEYFYKDLPKVIRKNRSSIGILNGDESDQDIALLGDDIFTYYGLGCRNVSKLFVPIDYDIERLAFAWKDRKEVLEHQKYANNYRYHKAVLGMDKVRHFDNGLLLLLENEKVIAPVAILHYQFFEDQQDLTTKLERQRNKTQCVVAQENWSPGSVTFGQAQHPHLWDYADNIDTLKFLTD